MAQSAISTVSTNDAFVDKIVQDRETIVRSYIAIISPDLVAMLQLRQYGDCTVDDPRACLNYHATNADLACIMHANASIQQWEAMIINNMIINKTRVLLHCTEFDSYVFVCAENHVRDSEKCKDRVEDIIRNMKTDQGRCRPGVDMLTLDYRFTQPPSYHRGKRQRDGLGLGPDKNAMVTTSYIMNARRFMKYVMQSKVQYDCLRTMQTTQRKEIVCRPGMKKKELQGSPAVAVMIIHGAFMLVPDSRFTEQSLRY